MARISRNLNPSSSDSRLGEEDRILRVWTPVVLRTVLVAAVVLLLAGLIATAIQAPGYYVNRFHAVQHSAETQARENLPALLRDAFAGDPRGIMTIGLVTLTLVPLARVAFTFILFLREGDHTYVVATAYVLIALIAGVVLGRIG